MKLLRNYDKMFVIFLLLSPILCHGAKVEIPSTFNPVGSGARAIGMGGAFIAVADDATAASWNPGGLIQLTKPEISGVGAYFHRVEDNRFDLNPSGDGDQTVFDAELNYVSAAYPFEFLNRNMIFSVNYQRLYDFKRGWNFMLIKQGQYTYYDEYWDFQQDGFLSAIGLAYCIEIVPSFTFGFTVNIWDDDLTYNHWTQTYKIYEKGKYGVTKFETDYHKHLKYSFSGVNANIGILWRLNRKLTLGAVVKTPFTADIEHQRYVHEVTYKNDEPEAKILTDQATMTHQEMDMPLSYGIGGAYRFTNDFMASIDIFKTHWDDVAFRDEDGNEYSPINGLPLNQADIDPIYQIRIGAEYRIVDADNRRIIPLRCGVFYDPAPAKGDPDDFYGFSLGVGWTQDDRFSVDFAYQFRYGNDIGAHQMENLGFSQDVTEHKCYLSVILYWNLFFKNKTTN